LKLLRASQPRFESFHTESMIKPPGRQPRRSFTVSVRKELVMSTGVVKFFNVQKGYGFIAVDGGGTDVFVHASAVERSGMHTLVEGQKVSFEIVQDKRSGKSSAENLQSE